MKAPHEIEEAFWARENGKASTHQLHLIIDWLNSRAVHHYNKEREYYKIGIEYKHENSQLKSRNKELEKENIKLEIKLACVGQKEGVYPAKKIAPKAEHSKFQAVEWLKLTDN